MKAWVRAVEEAVYDQADLRRGRVLARAGAVGGISLEAGEVRSAVAEGAELWSVSVVLPVFDAAARAAWVEAVAAASGRVGALLAGDLPHDLVEHAEAAGAELLPSGGELGTACTCAAWVDPCHHAVAVLLQLGWLIEDDPLVLVHLRGLPREDLLAGLHDHQPEVGPLDVALDAAARAARLLELLAVGDADDTRDREIDHLW